MLLTKCITGQLCLDDRMNCSQFAAWQAAQGASGACTRLLVSAALQAKGATGRSEKASILGSVAPAAAHRRVAERTGHLGEREQGAQLCQGVWQHTLGHGEAQEQQQRCVVGNQDTRDGGEQYGQGCGVACWNILQHLKVQDMQRSGSFDCAVSGVLHANQLP